MKLDPKGIAARTIAIAVALFILGYSIGTSRGNESMESGTEAHFQELIFGVPQDKFYVAMFEGNSGKLRWQGEYEKPSKVIQLVGKGNAFPGMVQPLAVSDYGLATGRISDTAPKYNSYLVELKNNHVVLDLGVNNSGGIYQDSFYFISAGELKRMDLETKQVVAVERNVSAVATSHKKMWKFTIDGVVVEVTSKTEKTVGTFNGIVTDAGTLDEKWIWYFLRRNEKSSGNLWLLNAETGEQSRVERKLPQCRLVLHKMIYRN